MSEQIYYFAYGSNMNPKRMQLRGVTFSSRILGLLHGYSMVFNARDEVDPNKGYANIVPDATSVAEGLLYATDEPSMQRLDTFEIGYVRQNLVVELADGTPVNAIAYVVDARGTADGLRPSKEYLGHLLGGEDLLSPAYSEKLRAVQTLD